jgi:branched-subunit amino acid aminotransferase/4-amino-4-deoxychorismate lyase
LYKLAVVICPSIRLIFFFPLLFSCYALFHDAVLCKIQANNAGAADAIMLDMEGFVTETNATNIFLVKNGQLHTPSVDHCVPGNTAKPVSKQQ